jgi:hypothetical protein
MTADTTRPAADDDASILIENLAGIADTCVRTIHVAVTLNLTYKAFKLAAEPGRRWRLPAVANVPVEGRHSGHDWRSGRRCGDGVPDGHRPLSK